MFHHRKCLALVAWLLAGTAATAQISPEIAYARGGPRADIYLSNFGDGTGRRLLYSGPSRSEVFHVDIRPGGGELAFEEHIKSRSGAGLTSTIKVINYAENGSITGSVRSFPLSCLSGSLDYHPTDGTLLYRDCSTPSRIRRLNTTTAPMTSTDLGLPHDAFLATWLNATNLLYYADGKYWKVSTADLTSPTEVLTAARGSLDPSTSGDKVLVSGFGEIRLLDIVAGQNPHFQVGDKGHFSADDQYVLYISGDPGSQYLLFRRTDGAGRTGNLAGKGNYTAVDWRN